MTRFEVVCAYAARRDLADELAIYEALREDVSVAVWHRLDVARDAIALRRTIAAISRPA